MITIGYKSDNANSLLDALKGLKGATVFMRLYNEDIPEAVLGGYYLDGTTSDAWLIYYTDEMGRHERHVPVGNVLKIEVL